MARVNSNAGIPQPHFHLAVIGAGQAGLATAQQLAHRGLAPGADFVALDANDGPGGAWRHRWDSLTLGKAHGIADLPGMAAPDGDDATPASQAVAQYYGTYEEMFHLAVHRPARVVRVEQPEATPHAVHRSFLLTLADASTLLADVVVSATGTWDHPFIPFIPGVSSFQGKQLHTKDYVRATDFGGQHVLVVGGGLSAVQFLLELEGPGGAARTTWATRRPPDFVETQFDAGWGRDVEKRVRERVFTGHSPASVVSTTGIPPWQKYVEARARGVLVSRGMFKRVDETGVFFTASAHGSSPELGELPGEPLAVDVIFWNTGFRHSLEHLAPLHLRSPRGGIAMLDEVTTKRNPRVLLAGYGSTASTIGATRAGRLAARAAVQALHTLDTSS